MLFFEITVRFFLLGEIFGFFITFVRNLVSGSVRMHGLTDSAMFFFVYITRSGPNWTSIIAKLEIKIFFFKQSHHGSAFYVRCLMRQKICRFLNLHFIHECRARFRGFLILNLNYGSRMLPLKSFGSEQCCGSGSRIRDEHPGSYFLELRNFFLGG
jgi:hypothetical protein